MIELYSAHSTIVLNTEEDSHIIIELLISKIPKDSSIGKEIFNKMMVSSILSNRFKEKGPILKANITLLLKAMFKTLISEEDDALCLNFLEFSLQFNEISEVKILISYCILLLLSKPPTKGMVAWLNGHSGQILSNDSMNNLIIIFYYIWMAFWYIYD